MKFIFKVFFLLSFFLSSGCLHSQKKEVNLEEELKTRDLSFSLTLPAVDNDNNSFLWTTIYYVIIDDEFISNICIEKGETLLPELVKLLDKKDCSWQANLMLYSITKENGIFLEPYSPNNRKLWEREKKDEDVKFWKSKLKQERDVSPQEPDDQ